MLLCGDDVRLDVHSYICFSMAFKATLERKPTPRGRATVSRPPHTEALGAPCERTGRHQPRRAGSIESWPPGVGK